jgi:hypothetical protein
MKSVATLAMAGAIVAGVLAQPGQAAAIEIQGSGLWGAGTPVTTYSAPGDSFSFDFDVPSPTEANPSALITNFTFDLAGVDVASVSDNPFITFYDTANGGLFDLFFPTSGFDVTFEGPQIGFDAGGTDTSGGPVSIIQGSFPFEATMVFGTPPTGSGTLGVPEPSSLLLLSAGVAALRTLRRRTSGKATA